MTLSRESSRIWAAAPNKVRDKISGPLKATERRSLSTLNIFVVMLKTPEDKSPCWMGCVEFSVNTYSLSVGITEIVEFLSAFFGVGLNPPLRYCCA